MIECTTAKVKYKDYIISFSLTVVTWLSVINCI